MKLFRITTSDISLDMLLKGQLRFLNEHMDVTAVSADSGLLKMVGEREGVRTIEVPMHREISLKDDWKCLWILYRLFKKERPDIIHANTPKGSLLSMVAGKMARVPVRIYYVTGLRYQGATGLLRWILKTMERVTCFCATKVIPEGNGVLKIIKEDHITGKELHVIHYGNISGIDTAYFSREGFPEKKDDAFRFIFIGRIVKDKGMHELVEAMRRFSNDNNYSNDNVNGNGNNYSNDNVNGNDNCLAECDNDNVNDNDNNYSNDNVNDNDNQASRTPTQGRKTVNVNVPVSVKSVNVNVPVPVKLLLVGPFESELDPLEKEDEEFLKNSECVEYVGYQKDVRPFLAKADALVFPSYREGFPNVVLQAGSMDLPSIVTDISGCNEIIKDGLNGRIIQPRNAEALYQTMKYFVEHPVEVKRMAGNARRMVQERFEQKDVWNALLKEYLKRERLF